MSKKECFLFDEFQEWMGFTIIEGVWNIGGQNPIAVVNMYCFGSLSEKRVVWKEISEARKNTTIKTWCVVMTFLQQVHCVVRSNNLSLRKDIEPTRNT